MYRLVVCVAVMCFANTAILGQDVGQDNPAAGGQSVTATPCGCSDCDCGNCDSTSLDRCGQANGFFKRCNGQRFNSDCGGCQSGPASGLLGRLGELMPRPDFILGNECCPPKYRSFFAGGVDLINYEGDNGNGTVIGSFRDGFILGTARGRYLNEDTRFEMEGTWRNNSGDFWTTPAGATFPFDGHFNVYSTMFNLVREIFNEGPANLYVGGGIGVAKQDGDFTVSGTNFSLDDWAFAYQGFGGVNLVVTENVDLFAEYRYYGNTTTDLNTNFGMFFDDFNYSSQNIIFGIRLMR